MSSINKKIKKYFVLLKIQRIYIFSSIEKFIYYLLFIYTISCVLGCYKPQDIVFFRLKKESESMKCPYCNSKKIKVIDKRGCANSDVIRRRRECMKCKKRFTTHEKIESIGLRIVKKDGKIESFDKDKIIKGMLKACEKRPVSIETIQCAADDIESELRKQKSIDIPSQKVGNLVMKKLKKIDKVAFIRFASVYREFKDVGEFLREVKSL